MCEVWKDVVGYEGLYQVSNYGRVYSIRRKKYLSPSVAHSGHLMVGLYKDGRQTLKGIHRLVAEAFIPNPDNLPIPHHIDENPKNNHVSNLKWVTQKENVHYCIASGKFGTMNRGKQKMIKHEPIIPYDVKKEILKKLRDPNLPKKERNKLIEQLYKGIDIKA